MDTLKREKKAPGLVFFSEQRHKVGEVIGVYAGLDITSRTVGRTEYTIQFGEHGERIAYDE